MSKNKFTSFSIIFTAFIAVINIINIALNGVLFDISSLDIGKITLNFEYWRLISYPFFFNTWESAILFLAVFVISSKQLEKILGALAYPVLLMLISVVLGLITTAIFITTSALVFGGLEGVSFFVLTLSLLLKLRNKVLPKRAIDFALGFLALLTWACLKYFVVVQSSFSVILPSVVISGLGIIAGTLVYIQINYILKVNLRKSKELQAKKIQMQSKTKIPTAEEIGLAMYTNNNFRSMVIKGNEQDKQDAVRIKMTSKDDSNEEILNYILDKINVYGKEALSIDELLFLEDYSRSLQNK